MRHRQWNMLWLLIIVAGASVLAGVLILRIDQTDEIGVAQDPAIPRIVTLSPAIAVILDDLGLSKHIVGRHAFDIVLDRNIPIVGDMNGIDYERLLRLDPTHILLENSAQPTPERLQSLANENGWKVHTIALLALDDIPQATGQLADLFENQQTHPRMESLMADFDDSLSPNRDAADRAGRVLPLYWTNPPGAAGPGSFHFEMLERLGFEFALSDGGPYITVDPEDILRMDPDSIILLMPGADPDRVEELLGPLARLDLRCVREGRVGIVNDPMVNLPATSISRVAREITRITSKWTRPTQDVAN